MATKIDVRTMVKVFGLLSVDVRLNIIIAIRDSKDKKLNVTSLCEILGLPQPTISHHLGLLRNGGLVNDTREGKQVMYAIADDFPSPLTIANEKIN
jgi:DNA-binding transcriptional ArsR family regulator